MDFTKIIQSFKGLIIVSSIKFDLKLASKMYIYTSLAGQGLTLQLLNHSQVIFYHSNFYSILIWA